MVDRESVNRLLNKTWCPRCPGGPIPVTQPHENVALRTPFFEAGHVDIISVPSSQ